MFVFHIQPCQTRMNIVLTERSSVHSAQLLWVAFSNWILEASSRSHTGPLHVVLGGVFHLWERLVHWGPVPICYASMILFFKANELKRVLFYFPFLPQLESMAAKVSIFLLFANHPTLVSKIIKLSLLDISEWIGKVANLWNLVNKYIINTTQKNKLITHRMLQMETWCVSCIPPQQKLGAV